MPDFCFAPQPRPTIAIADSAKRFPVRRVFCVGRNYAEHTREMGGDPDREDGRDRRGEELAADPRIALG